MRRAEIKIKIKIKRPKRETPRKRTADTGGANLAMGEGTSI
jgi:hypothetical protein